MNNSDQQGAWWRAQNKDRLQERINHISRINDPGTVADEVLFYGKWLMYLLLAFTGLLGAFSYYRFFSESFPVEVAFFLSFGLTLFIEAGKNYAGRWAIRIPLFQGFSSIASTPANTFAWVGLLLAAAATFSMSVYNSTKGSEQLSLLLHHERTEQAFSPNTKDIDDQIAAAQARMAQNNNNKWKGVVIYESQKANRKETDLLNKLQDQRQKEADAQRADFERNRQIADSQGAFSAKSVMAAGGWVEALQLILLIILVSCEKILDKREGQPSPSPASGIGFRQQTQQSYRPAQGTAPDERRPIGFNRGEDGNVRAATAEMPQHAVMAISVPQLPQSVPQTNGLLRGKEADEAILYHLQRLQKEPGNFDNKHAVAATVAKRVHGILDDLERTLGTLSECSVDVAERTATYILDKIQPKLREHDTQHNLTNILSTFRTLVA